MPSHALRSLFLAALALGSASCAATRTSYDFEPSPADVVVDASPGGPAVARVLVGVTGAERRGGQRSGHPDLIVRLRVEAKGPGGLRFDPASATVLGPDLAEFGAPTADVPGPIEVPSGEARDVTLRFPFPLDGDLRMPGLTGINFSVVLDTVAGSRQVSVTLERHPYDRYDDPYWYDRTHWHWHFGYAFGYDC